MRTAGDHTIECIGNTFACFPSISFINLFFYSRSQVFLKVECMTDGIWMFPMMLIATEPDVDGVFDIEGVGLFKESTVDFRLTSQTR